MIYKNIFNTFFILLFFPTFILGVSITNYLMAIFILFNFIFNYRKLYIEIKNNLIVVSYFFIFYLVLIISSSLSNYPNHSFQTSALYFVLIFYSLSFVILFKEKKYYINLFLISGLLTCFLLSIDGLYELIFGSNLLGFYSIEGRIAGFFGDRWLIGRYLISILPILIGIYHIENNHLLKIQFFFYLTVFLSSLTILFSGERAAFLILIIYVALILIFYLKKINITKILFMIIIIGVLFISPFLFTDTSNRLQHNFILYLTSTDLDKNQYLSLFLTAWNMFIESPIIGIGPNNFRLLCSDDAFYLSQFSCSTHPHSITFQLLAEVGIIGTMLIYSVFLFICLKSFKLIQRREFSSKNFGIFSILTTFILYLFPFMITGNFFLSWYGYIFYLPISLYIFYKNEIN